MRVEINVIRPGHGSIMIDGQDIGRGLCGFTLESKAGQLPRLVLDLAIFYPYGAVGEMDLVVPEGTAAALVALGWTPPSEDPS